MSLRRSVSTGTLDVSPIKILPEEAGEEVAVEAGLRLEEAMDRLAVEGEGARMRQRLEEVEAELATAR